MNRPDIIINKFNLEKHPEGGHFAETYRSRERLDSGNLPERYKETHSFGTSIYYLLKSGEISRLHRLQTDEIWHFYEGCPLRLIIIDEQGSLEEIILGKDIADGQVFQAVVPSGRFFCAEPVEENSYSFTGCTMAPGFEYSDFELARSGELIARYPFLKDFIIKYT